MDTHDSFYDYDISTINCVNISQVKTDFRISDDEDDETLKEPKKFYTLTNFVESIDVKQEINGDNNDNSQPSTDIPIAIIETQPSKEYDDLNHEGELLILTFPSRLMRNITLSKRIRTISICTTWKNGRRRRSNMQFRNLWTLLL